MSKERKAYKMAESIVARSGGKIAFSDAIGRTRRYFRKKPIWAFFWNYSYDSQAEDIILGSLTEEAK